MRNPSRLVALLSAGFALCPLTPLPAGEIHDAATAGDLDKVKTLLEADPQLLESKDGDGETPLIKACVGVPDNITQASTASFLMDQGANVNASGLGGRTPLMCVNKRQDGCIDLMQRLIARGADVNACMSYTSRKWTVFCGAAKSGNVDAARLLIQHGADIDVRDIEGTPLHMAINSNRPISGNLAEDRRRNEAMAVLLVESGATLQEFSFGNTELHLAAIRGFAELVRALVSRGADVNAVNEYGRTPLYYAARHGHRRAADALRAAGADNRAVNETNHGKAPQLIDPLRDGEAWLWYLAPNVSPNTGYAIKTKNNLLIFDPAWSGESSDTGLANGYLNPAELAGQRITVLIGHPSYGRDIPGWAKQLPGANFVLGFKATPDIDKARVLPPYRLAVPHERFRVGEIQVHPIPAASRLFGREGLGYLVEVDGVKIFHAGLHAASGNADEQEAYRREVDCLKRSGPIDFAILPITGRHITVAYEPYLHLIDQLSPKAIYLIGEELTTGEHKKCVEVLRARNVPVFYPEGGIAMGERFHFVRDRPLATPAPDAAVPENRTIAVGTAGRASFQGLGDLPGGDFESLGLRVSADGSTVVGHGTMSSGKQAFRWTQAEGMVSLGNLSDVGFKQSWAVGVSADGSVIVGYGDPDGSGTWERRRGFRWTSPGGMAEMPRLRGSTRDEALAVSADGSVIVGDGGVQAFRWTSDSGISELGTLGVRTNSRAIALSADGSVAVGSSYDLPSWDNEEAFLWTRERGMKGLGHLPGGGRSFPNAISADGTVVVGTSDSSSGSAAFRWTQSTGMVSLDHLPGRKITHPGAVTANGDIVVGASFIGPREPAIAFIWNARHGMRSLQPVLESEYGLDLSGWHLQSASGITPDGSVIVGWGSNPSGQTEAFRAVLKATPPKTAVTRAEPFACDYLNETPPGDEPVVFGRGVLSVEGKNTHGLAFSPDGRMLIFSRYPDRTSFRMVQGKDGWLQPERTSFTGKEVTFAADGKRLLYYDRGELFAVRYDAGEFSAPIKLGAAINTPEAEYYPCMTGRGNLFFSRNSNWSEGRIMVAQPEGDGFAEPVDLGDVVNEGGASHGFVAPDESYLLFNSPRPGSTTKNDIWVSVRGPDGAWQAPVNLGPRINRDAVAVLCPTVSPDGKYLFFTRLQEGGTGLLYWVSTASIPALRPTISPPHSGEK